MSVLALIRSFSNLHVDAIINAVVLKTHQQHRHQRKQNTTRSCDNDNDHKVLSCESEVHKMDLSASIRDEACVEVQ